MERTAAYFVAMHPGLSGTELRKLGYCPELHGDLRQAELEGEIEYRETEEGSCRYGWYPVKKERRSR